MKALYSKKMKNYLDALKFAYSFMSSKYLYKKECSFYNSNPTKFDPVFVVPRDSVLIFYDESNIPSWGNFKATEEILEFCCIGAIDELDNCRISCSFIDGYITFACYGDYERLAKDAMESIIRNQSRLM